MEREFEECTDEEAEVVCGDGLAVKSTLIDDGQPPLARLHLQAPAEKGASSRTCPTPMKKPHSYWKDFAHIEQELRAFLAQQGTPERMATHAELYRAGRTDLMNAILRYGGGYHAVAERLGFHKNRGKWNDFTHIEQELRAFLAQSDTPERMPTKGELYRAGRTDLMNAILRYGGGYHAVAERLGLHKNRRPRGINADVQRKHMVSEEKDSPWPRRGDHLFADGQDWYNNAVLNGQRDNLSLYAVGYKRAGELLAEAVMESRRDHDSLVFPIAYVYRQYLELRLKQLIRDSRRLLGDSSGFPATHKIAELWKLCRPLLDQAGLNAGEQVLEAIEELIAEFAEVDDDSFAFRYPTDKRNNPSLPDLCFVNLPNLADVIRKMSNFFEAASWHLSVTLERETVPRLSTSNASDLEVPGARQQPREFEPQEEKDAGPLISG